MFVVEINSMGADIFFCRMVPGEKECFVVNERCGSDAETSTSESFLLFLVVKARESDIFNIC